MSKLNNHGGMLLKQQPKKAKREAPANAKAPVKKSSSAAAKGKAATVKAPAKANVAATAAFNIKLSWKGQDAKIASVEKEANDGLIGTVVRISKDFGDGRVKFRLNDGRTLTGKKNQFILLACSICSESNGLKLKSLWNKSRTFKSKIVNRQTGEVATVGEKDIICFPCVKYNSKLLLRRRLFGSHSAP